MVGLLVVHPIDTIKCRLQTMGPSKPGPAPMFRPPPPRHISAIATASSLVRRDGLLALYRGVGAPMFAYGLVNAVAFSTNTTVMRYLRDGEDVG